jgi:hypothetical protein
MHFEKDQLSQKENVCIKNKYKEQIRGAKSNIEIANRRTFLDRSRKLLTCSEYSTFIKIISLGANQDGTTP